MKITLALGGLLAAAFLSSNAMAVDCSNLPTWSSTAVYTQGNQVKHNNKGYTANYWTQNNNPTTSSGPWQHWADNGACDGVTSSSSVPSSSSSSAISSSSIVSSSSSSVVASSSSSTGGGTCPQYVAGTSYILGAVVSNAGGNYTCQIPGWCSSTAAWAYAPGTGSYWTSAWTAGGSCGGVSSSSIASSSTVSSSSSSVVSSSSSSVSSSSSSAPTGSSQLIGYWENWHWPLLEPVNVPNYTVLNISFPRINADGSLTLTNADFTQNNPTPAQVAAAQAQGKKVLLSIGGATTPLALTSAAHENNFVNSFIAIADQWGLDGIDIDTEKGLHTAPNALINETNPQYSADYLVRAIKRIKAHYGSSFMVTMAPETAHTIGAMLPANWQGSVNWGVYLPLMNALRNEITWVQMQYYNTGSMPGLNGSFYNSATQNGLVAWTEAMIEGFAIANTGVQYQGLPANKIVIGLPTSSATSAAGSGYTNPTIVKAALRCLRSGDCGSGYKPAKTYPDLRGVMGWSVNEDNLVNYFFSSSLQACVLQNQCN
jgi:chitinase